MRPSSYLNLSSIAALIVCISTYPRQTISGLPPHGAAVILQSPEGMSEQLDTKLAKSYGGYVYTFENRISQAIEANGVKPQQIEIVRTTEGHSIAGYDPSGFPPGSSPQVWGEVMNSDLIVIGKPVKARVLPAEDRTFAFTEYAVQVEKVIAADQNRVLPGDTIVVSRGGGEITVDNVLIKAIDPAFSEFLLNQRYVLMLRSVPPTTSYRAYASGTYAVRDGRVFSISTIVKSTAPPKDLSSFISDVDAALERKRAVAEERRRSARN